MAVPSNEELAKIAENGELVENMAKVARKSDDKSLEFFRNYIVARLAKMANKTDLSYEFFKLCIGRQPTIATLRFELVDLLWSAERYQDMVEQCESAIKRLPNDFEFYEYRARGLAMLKKFQEAEEGLTAYLKKQTSESKLVQGALVLVWVDQRAEKIDSAIKRCHDILAKFPKAEQVGYTRYLLSGVYMQADKQDESEKQLEKIIAMSSETVAPALRAAAENDLGYLWADRGIKLDEAEKLIRSALKVKPDSAAYLDSLGWVLFRKEKFSDAVEALEKAVSADDTEDGVLHEHLGDAYLKVGQKEKAKSTWDKALKLYQDAGDDPRSQKRAKDLKGKIQSLEG